MSSNVLCFIFFWRTFSPRTGRVSSSCQREDPEPVPFFRMLLSAEKRDFRALKDLGLIQPEEEEDVVGFGLGLGTALALGGGGAVFSFSSTASVTLQSETGRKKEKIKRI